MIHIFYDAKSRLRAFILQPGYLLDHILATLAFLHADSFIGAGASESITGMPLCRPAAGVFQQLLLFTLLVPDSVAKDLPDPCRSALLPGFSAVVIGAFDVSLLCVCSRIGPASGRFQGLASGWHISACRPSRPVNITCTPWPCYPHPLQ